ncbi:sensor histidine kinase [Bifidobacterium ruminantium]|uniref:sensor histidine kinase n=1 Tax=Bifidobacterium ruminantium TaxID=78346 RepID=UPI000A9C9CAE|nr:GHKL domain-containing protein [Bifidobacterium ruminantium]
MVWCLPADNSSLLDARVLEIAFTVAVFYTLFMALAYFLIWYMIKQSDSLLEAHRREHYEAMQTLQLQHMDERIREARQIKHNVRHHIHSLQALAADDDMDGIRSYLEEASKHHLLQPAPMQYCEHTSLNAVLVYYCDWIRHLGADVDVKASVPQYIGINNAELCSMVGNLLENATDAITRQTSGCKRLKMRVQYRPGPPSALFITVDNTYDADKTDITRIDDGFASTKHGGNGLGTATVRETAERHHGTATFDYGDGVFRASVMLCLDD